MAKDPQIRFLDESGPVVGVSRIQMPVMFRSDNYRGWGVVSDNDRFAFKRLGKLLGQPGFGGMVASDEVIGSQASVSRISPDVIEVVHPLPRHPARSHLVARCGKVRPRYGAQDASAVDDDALVLEQMDMGLSGVSHFLKSSIDVAIIKFVVATDVHGRATERFIRPFYAASFLIDVPGEDH